jgi:CheY-like chemotaxis protein
MSSNVVPLQASWGQQGTAPSAQRRTILVIEDEVLTRMLVADELRSCGFTVVEAQNADEAVAVLQSQAPVGLVFTDVQLPGSMDGLELAKRVRATHPELKVVIASGNMKIENGAEVADAFFPKPYDLQRVIAFIEKLLADGHA